MQVKQEGGMQATVGLYSAWAASVAENRAMLRSDKDKVKCSGAETSWMKQPASLCDLCEAANCAGKAKGTSSE